jgi:hypothetical protein
MVHAAQVRSYIFWIDWPGNSPSNEPTADAWSRHGVRCIDEARECDVLLFVNGEDEQACGVLIEAWCCIGGRATAVRRLAWRSAVLAPPQLPKLLGAPGCYRGHCGDADGCARLLGQHLRHEQPIILVLAWQSTTAGRTLAVAGPGPGRLVKSSHTVPHTYPRESGCAL